MCRTVIDRMVCRETAPQELPVEIPVCEGDTVPGDEEVRVVEVGGGRVCERQLNRPLPEFRLHPYGLLRLRGLFPEKAPCHGTRTRGLSSGEGPCHGARTCRRA